jgi:hypothetical protein
MKLKKYLSDRNLKLGYVKLELQVIANQHVAVNIVWDLY